MTEDAGPFEHKHRWQVEIKDSVVVETCRCSESRTRPKSRYEYEAYKPGGKGHSRRSRATKQREDYERRT